MEFVLNFNLILNQFFLDVWRPVLVSWCPGPLTLSSKVTVMTHLWESPTVENLKIKEIINYTAHILLVHKQTLHGAQRLLAINSILLKYASWTHQKSPKQFNTNKTMICLLVCLTFCFHWAFSHKCLLFRQDHSLLRAHCMLQSDRMPSGGQTVAFAKTDTPVPLSGTIFVLLSCSVSKHYIEQ